MFFRIIYESIVQAWQSLVGNRVRTFLSLIGISIGIFCIVAVLSAVDSLKYNMNKGLSEFGDDVVYIVKRPFINTSLEDRIKFAKRPDIKYDDFKLIKERVKSAKNVTLDVYSGVRLIKYNSNEIENPRLVSGSYEYAEVHNMKIEKGRHFTMQEYLNGSNKVILGSKMAENLFESLDPVGRTVKIDGLKFQVIGVLEFEGESQFNYQNNDEAIWLAFTSLRKLVNEDTAYMQIGVQVNDGVSLDELEDELTGIMRGIRRLPPSEGDNFSFFTVSQLNNIVGQVMGVLNISGGVIAFFSLVIGMFSVANIMFVSVKERTNIIGVKKALGAMNYVILLEFLIEAVVLCIIGGLVGISLVLLLSVIAGATIGDTFIFMVSPFNITLGIITSVVVGVIAGVIPAFQASKMDPVEAIRG